MSLASLFKERLPINRKEVYDTATVLPCIVVSGGHDPADGLAISRSRICYRCTSGIVQRDSALDRNGHFWCGTAGAIRRSPGVVRVSAPGRQRLLRPLQWLQTTA